MAQSNLGMMYANGLGAPRDDAEAYKWNLLAAEQGLPAAQINLGSMYFDGRGVERDLQKAIQLLLPAAKEGNADAQYRVGIAYFESEQARNLVQAYVWLGRAAAQGDQAAVTARDKVREQMTPQQLEQAGQVAAIMPQGDGAAPIR